MKKENWTHMPHNGHFILGSKCRFVLNTYVGGYIVSTVGELDNDSTIKHIHASIHDPVWYELNKHQKGDNWNAVYFKKFGFDEIGYKTTYETMVFKAKKDTHPENQCCPYTASDWSNIDYDSYSDAVSARKGHEALCKKWAVKK